MKALTTTGKRTFSRITSSYCVKVKFSDKQVTEMENLNPTEDNINILKILAKGVLLVNIIETLNILRMVK